MSAYLHHFVDTFATLNADCPDRLGELYSNDVQFRDPLHQQDGLPVLRSYFKKLYTNVEDIRYDLLDADKTAPGQGYLRWILHFRHPRLSHGQPISLHGCNHLRWATHVYLHHDYIDTGALLYLPVYFQCCASLLKDDGLMLLQAITLRDQRYEQARRSVDFIQRYIFHGGALPSLSVMLQIASCHTALNLVHMEDFGLDYARRRRATALGSFGRTPRSAAERLI